MPKSTQRIVLISSCDGLSSISSRNLFAGDNLEIVGIVEARTSLAHKLKILRNAVLAGSFYYAVYIQFEALMGRLAARRLRGKDNTQIPDLRDLDMPRHITLNPNDQPTVKFIRELKPDVVLAIRPVHVFRKPLLDAVPPVVNLHCTALPKHRGIAGIMRALAAGDKTLGATLHSVTDEKIDSGSVVSQRFTNVHSKKSVLFHALQLYWLSGDMIPDALMSLGDTTSHHVESDENDYSSWPPRKKLIQLKNQGHKLIELRDFWSIYRNIRDYMDGSD